MRLTELLKLDIFDEVPELGSHIEFKTGAEIDLVFANGIRIGPVFDHVSNAGIGKHNPGEENLLLMVSVPLGTPLNALIP